MVDLAGRLPREWRPTGGRGRRVLHGGLLAVAAQAGRTAFQLGLTALLARLLVPEDFGLVAIAAGLAGIGSVVAELGLSLVTIQRRHIDHALSSGFFYANLLAGIVAALAVAAAAPLVAAIFGEPRLAWVTLLLAGTIPLLAASRQPLALLQRAMRWRAVQVVGSVPPLVAGLVAAGLALAGFGVTALLALAWTSAVLTLALSWRLARWRPGGVGDWRRLRGPLREGLVLSAYGLADAIAGQADDQLLGWCWGPAVLGLYGRAQALIMLPTQLMLAPLSSALIPALSRLQDEPRALARLYRRAVLPVMLASGLSSALFVGLAGPVVEVVLGPQWNAAVPMLEILGFAVLPLAASRTAAWLWIARGQSGQLARWTLFTLPLWLAGFALAVPSGPVAMAAAFAAAATILASGGLFQATRGMPGLFASLGPAWLTSVALALASGIGGRALLGVLATGNPLVDLCLFGGAISMVFLASAGAVGAACRRRRTEHADV
jgi:PST family polysaccharide transporter